jgi:hypothetical protein
MSQPRSDGPDEQRVDPVNGGNRLDVLERLAGFDLGDQADLRIGRPG